MLKGRRHGGIEARRHEGATEGGWFGGPSGMLSVRFAWGSFTGLLPAVLHCRKEILTWRDRSAQQQVNLRWSNA